MINVLTKIHDKFTLEFKVSFKGKRQLKTNNFALNTWVFIPHSLDVNPRTYTRTDFYKDIRTNVRLITPVFLLRDIIHGEKSPLFKLKRTMEEVASAPTETNIAEYEYQIKMFAAIYKSAIRDQLKYIFQSADTADRFTLTAHFLEEIGEILTKYRALAKIIQNHTVTQENYNYFLFGDEFMLNLTEKELFALLDKLKHPDYDQLRRSLSEIILAFLEKEKEYKTEHNYQQVEPACDNKNSELIFRFGALKKYIESDLFLNARMKRDGVIVEQVYYSMAAGLSMIFATGIAFSFQQAYGNFTMPLFVALVVSYMLKDRIKDLMRFYFAHKMSGKYYDNKTTFSVKDKEIGWSKEGFDFIPEMNVPKQVLLTRNRLPIIQADNRHAKEKIFLYKKIVQIKRTELDRSSDYNVEGIVEIIRYNVSAFMKKMDNPEVPLYVIDQDNQASRIMGTKLYFLNIVLQYKPDDEEQLIRYSIAFNREGIKSITKMN